MNGVCTTLQNDSRSWRSRCISWLTGSRPVSTLRDPPLKLSSVGVFWHSAGTSAARTTWPGNFTARRSTTFFSSRTLPAH